MPNAGASRPSRTSLGVLSIAAVTHAALVLTAWVGEFYAGFSMLSGKLWLVLAWSWLAWPFVLAAHPGATRRRVAVPIILGLILLVPCLSTIFLFSVWMLD